jgi:hypothetical protein
MAVNRENERPTCSKCGERINGRYRDQEDVNWDRMFVGDTFQGWDFEGHKKVCKGSVTDYLYRNEPGEYRVVINSDKSFYIHPINRDGETYDFKPN